MSSPNKTKSLENAWQTFTRKTKKKFRIPVGTPKINPSTKQLCEKIREQKITYLTMQRLCSIVSLCEEINRNKIDGDMIEAGCALGGSAIVLTAVKGAQRALSIYDTFGMIPPPGPNDGQDVHKRYEKIATGGAKGIDGGDDYYGYRDDIPQQVRSSFEANGYPIESNQVELVKGLVEDTLAIEGPICFAHIDVDWYSPVNCCLERIVPHLSVGGAIVMDDYLDWSGCHEAANDFFSGQIRRQFRFHTRYGHLVAQRVAKD